METRRWTCVTVSQAAGRRTGGTSSSTYSRRFSRCTRGFGHLSQDLVPVAGRVSSSFDLLLSYFLTVDVESDAGGRNQDVELRKEKEEENGYLWNLFVVSPTVVSGFDPDGLQMIRTRAVLLVEPEPMCSTGLMKESCFPVQRCCIRLDRNSDDSDTSSLSNSLHTHGWTQHPCSRDSGGRAAVPGGVANFGNAAQRLTVWSEWKGAADPPV